MRPLLARRLRRYLLRLDERLPLADVTRRLPAWSTVYASFDRRRAEEVRKDCALAGHMVQLHEVVGGLDEAQREY